MRTILSLFIFISSFSFAQDFQGKAYYMSKISIDKSFMDNPRFASRRGYMENMIKRNTEKYEKCLLFAEFEKFIFT